MPGMTKEQKQRLLEEQKKRKLIKIKEINIDLDGKSAELTHKKKPPKATGFKKKERRLKFGFFDRWKLDKHPESSYIVTMLFGNGTLKTWVVKTNKDYFDMKGKTYNFVADESFFDLSLNQYHYFFHESHPTPINREVEQVGNESYFKVNPSALKSLINQSYVKALIGAEELVKTTKILLILVVINLLVTIGILVLSWSG